MVKSIKYALIYNTLYLKLLLLHTATLVYYTQHVVALQGIKSCQLISMFAA